MTQFICKFYVWQILKSANFEGVNITLKPVLNDAVNESFSKWTPGGEIQLSISNPELVDKFQVNQEFMISFEEFIKAPVIAVEPKSEPLFEIEE